MNHSERQGLEKRRELLIRKIEIKERLQTLDSGDNAPKGFAPEADRTPFSYEDAGIEKSDINFLKSINQRELNQAEGKGSPLESFGDVAAQALSFAANPLREVFDREKVKMGNFISPVDKLRASGIQRKIQAAEAGINSGQGISWGSRAIASLGLSDSDKALAAKSDLNSRFGADIKIGKDDATGEMVYMNPDDKKLYPLDPLGLDGGDFTAMLGPAIVAIPETIGTVTGAISGAKKKAVGKIFKDKAFSARQKKELAGGAFGAAVGEFARITLGQEFGLAEDVNFLTKVNEGLKEAGISAGAGIAFESFASIAKWISRAKGEKVIPGSILRQMEESFKKVDLKTEQGGNEAVRLINKALYEGESDIFFQPNIGQIQDNPEIKDIIEALKQPGSEQKKVLVEREVQNQEAQRQYFEKINNDVSSADPQGASKLGQDIRSITDKTLAKETELAESPLLDAQKLSRSITGDLATTKQLEAGRKAKAALTLEEKIFYDAANRDYTKLGAQADAIGAVPDSSSMKKEILELDKSSSKVKEDSIQSLLEQGELEPEAEWSVSSIGDTIKSLRAKKRAADNGHINADSGRIKKAISILSKFKIDALKDYPDLLLKQEALDIAYREGKDIFDKGVIQTILTNKDALPDSKIFQRIITSGDSTTSQNVSAAIMDHPEAVLAMQQGINKLYKQKVVKNGIANLADHQKFVNDYIDSEIITPFFKKSELKQLRTVGAVGKLVDLKQASRDKAMEKVNNLFVNKIKNLESRTLLSRVWGPEKQINIRELKVALKDHPETWKSLQAEVLNDIKVRAMPNGVFSVKTLNNILEKQGGSIKELMGEGYFKNLTVLKQSLDITGRTGAAMPIDKSNALMDLTRAYVGVFTTPGRFVTAANRFRSLAARRVMTEMILDPDKIRKLSALRRARSGSRTAGLLFAQLGASELAIMRPPGEDAYDRLMKEQIEWEKQKVEKRKKKELAAKKKIKSDRINFLKQQQSKLRSYPQ